MKTTLETAIDFGRWIRERDRWVFVPGDALLELAKEFESGKLIILRTGGEVRIRSVDL